MELRDILERALSLKVSDIHFAVALPPVFRVGGNLVPQEDWPPLKPDALREMLLATMSPEQQEIFLSQGEVDYALSMPGVGRYRVNTFRQRGTVAAALRLVSSRIPPLAELGLPPVVATLTELTRGMVLVTGPTGSGKSTTLAAMIDLINQHRRTHIITLEDPIEYLHPHKMSVVHQREIGSDSQSFANALRAALRQDPDVVLVGEMRDLETISIALTAAETGHLVFATLHTSSAAQTIDRVIDVFPPNQQQQARVQLAEALQGIIAQQLITRADRPGRVAAIELLMVTPAVRNLIREGKTHQIISVIQTGGRLGMQSLDSALANLFRQGAISREEVMNRANDQQMALGMR